MENNPKPNTNPFTYIVCDLDHRPKGKMARKHYRKVQKIIADKVMEKTGWDQAEVDEGIFSANTIQRIARVLAKIRIMDK